MNKNNVIRRGASFPVLFVEKLRFQYATTTPALPIRYAVPFNSFFQYIIIQVRQVKITLGLMFRIRCSGIYIVDEIFNHYITTKRERSQYQRLTRLDYVRCCDRLV